MATVGYILLVFGLIVWFYGQLRFLVVAYSRSFWWLFGCLFLPLVGLLFLFLNFRTAVKPFGLSLFGLIVAGLGGWMTDVDWPM